MPPVHRNHVLALLLAGPLCLASPARAEDSGGDVGAQITATRTAEIGAPMSGRLNSFPLRDGDRFAAGDVLAAFQCDGQNAAVLHARAEVAKGRDVLDTQTQLRSLGSYSSLDYKVAGSELKAANADLALAEANEAQCVVRAPFAGRVSAVQAHAWQFMQVGAPMIEILDDADLEIEMIVPSNWLRWLAPHQRFQVRVDETGATYPADIVRVSGRVDAVSRTVKVYARFASPDAKLLPGMSGTASLSRPKA